MFSKKFVTTWGGVGVGIATSLGQIKKTKSPKIPNRIHSTTAINALRS